MSSTRPARPVLLGPRAMASRGLEDDAAQRVEAAHTTAAALVARGRASADPQVRARLVGVVADHGLETIAELWAERPARSLPGALWRLYALWAAVHRDAEGLAREFRAGERAEVARAVAGVVEPPEPSDLVRLLDQVLHGVYGSDLDVALDRAAAFCRVVAVGRACDDGPGPAAVGLGSAADLMTTARDLEAAAALSRRGALD